MKKYLITVLMALFALSIWTGSVTAYELEGIDIHGFISQGYLISSDYNYLANNTKDGSFEYSEMGINFSKQLNDKLRVGLQFFSRDVGDAGNNKITVDWAYADYRFQDWLGVRVGKIKLPLGLYNETRDIDMLRTCIVLPQGIYYDMLRDTLIATSGAGLYGNKDLGGLGFISYQAIVGVLPSDTEGGTSKYFENYLQGFGLTLKDDFDPGTSYTGSLWWETPLVGLKAGYSYFKSYNDIPLLIGGAVPTTLEGVAETDMFSVEYTWDRLLLAAEYMEREIERKILGNKIVSTQESYYILASYGINDWLTVGGYYSESYPYKDDKDGLNQPIDHMAWEKDIALTLRFDMNEYWVLKVEGHRVDGTANVLQLDNQDNTFSESEYYYGAAKVTVSF